MQSGVIYCAISPSGKKYYGFSINFYRRKLKHKNQSKRNISNYFYTAIRKYGFEAFKWSIVENIEAENIETLKKCMSEREKFWIKKDKTNSKEFGYNMTDGGEGRMGPLSESTKEKMRKPKSEKTKDLMKIARKGRTPNKGNHHSEITKEQMSKSHLGQIPWITGLSHSEKSKDKMSKSHIGKPSGNSGKPAWNKGKPWSEEVKQHMRKPKTKKGMR